MHSDYRASATDVQTYCARTQSDKRNIKKQPVRIEHREAHQGNTM